MTISRVWQTKKICKLSKLAFADDIKSAFSAASKLSGHCREE